MNSRRLFCFGFVWTCAIPRRQCLGRQVASQLLVYLQGARTVEAKWSSICSHPKMDTPKTTHHYTPHNHITDSCIHLQHAPAGKKSFGSLPAEPRKCSSVVGLWGACAAPPENESVSRVLAHVKNNDESDTLVFLLGSRYLGKLPFNPAIEN